jgi:hypothetical protein
LQSTWRGKRARDEVKDVKALRDFAIGDPSGLDVNVRKKQEARKKVRGGVHGGTLRVVIRHVHFLRGVFLHVRVVGASDLLAMDSNGLSDPYVKVTLVDLDGVPYKRQVHRTPFEFATLDPKWDVSFFMGAADLNLRQTKIKFEVFDYDQWSADDPMGVTEFPLVVFDEDEQAMIRRAAKWRSKKRKEARARARGDLSPAPSPAFLPGIGGLIRNSSQARQEMEDDARFASGSLDVDGESDDAESDETDPDSPASLASNDKNDSPKRSLLTRLARKTDLTAVQSVRGFSDSFNKDRKTQARMLMRAGVFGLDKPLVAAKRRASRRDVLVLAEQSLRVFDDRVQRQVLSFFARSRGFVKASRELRQHGDRGEDREDARRGGLFVEQSGSRGGRRKAKGGERRRGCAGRDQAKVVRRPDERPGHARGRPEGVPVRRERVLLRGAAGGAGRARAAAQDALVQREETEQTEAGQAEHLASDRHQHVVRVLHPEVRQESCAGFPRVVPVQRASVRQELLGETALTRVVAHLNHQAVLRVGHPGVSVRHAAFDAGPHGRVAALRVHLQLQGHPVFIRGHRDVPGRADVHGLCRSRDAIERAHVPRERPGLRSKRLCARRTGYPTSRAPPSWGSAFSSASCSPGTRFS